MRRPGRPDNHDPAARSVIARIDRAFTDLPEVRPGAGPYTRRLADVLFDAAHELTILMHGLSRPAPPNSRDKNYHRGFHGRAP